MNIYFVGLSGVPYKKRACDTRLISFAKVFISMGNKVTILNRLPIVSIKKRIVPKNEMEQIEVIELFNIETSKSSLVKIIRTIYSYPKEAIHLIKLNKKEHIDILHLYTGHYFDFLHYFFISKIIRAKVVYQYVEVRSQISRKGVYHRINGYLCDRLGYKLFNGIITISTYIDTHLKKLEPNLPTIKVPPICDFKFFDNVEKSKSIEPYVLYCGSAGYFDVIKIIIDGYNLSSLSKLNIKLKLVLNGTEPQKLKILNYINNKQILISSDLKYEELVKEYVHSMALLIPLRNNIQDIARFPNKICEYTASKGLIITTDFGEIPFYFSNNINALIAKIFSSTELAKKLDIMANMNEDERILMKKNAYQLGLSSFNSSIYSKSLHSFLTQLIEN